MKQIVCCLLLCILYRCSAQTQKEKVKGFPKPPKIPEPNDYVDDIVSHVKELITNRKLDPYSAIDTQLVGVHVKGSLVGLGTLEREGDSAVVYTSNKDASIEMQLKAHLLRGQLQWNTRIFGYNIAGTAAFSVQQVHLDVKLTMDLTKSHFILEKFDILTVGHVNVELNVIPLFDFVVSTISNAIAAVTKNIVFRMIDGPVRSLLQQVLDEHIIK